MPPMAPKIAFDNISDGETLYQRCVLITGKCSSPRSDEDFITITSHDASSTSIFPPQTWPISNHRFKALIILSPGQNMLTFQHNHNGSATGSVGLTLTYIPLLQTPPLYLVIMVAKDSPLIIDCPSHKRGGVSSAHSDLNAAINKFRMTAYMWQALTAEDMRSKGLGRRAFRLEEEWTAETLSRDFLQLSNEASGTHMRSTARIHVIKTEKAVAELRDPNIAQMNSWAQRKEELFTLFEAALKAHGGPFASSANPVVAGLILDSAYSAEQNMVLGHAALGGPLGALGGSNRTGISLGMFGSHLTYSWPRFLEEVPACLMDTAVPGDMVGNDNGECGTMWEACTTGQGAFLHEVGHAFGAPHTTGIMARGYAQDWPKNFLSKTAYCAATKSAGSVVDDRTKNDARWDISDALSFKIQPHFRLPTDPVLSKEALAAEPSVHIAYEDEESKYVRLVISCPTPIIRLKFNGIQEAEPTISTPASKLQFTMDELESLFDRTKRLEIDVLAMNRKSRVVGNAWKLFPSESSIHIPGSSIILQKRSVMSNRYESSQDDDQDFWEWAVMLQEKGADGKLTPAIEIDSRVGAVLDGAVVYFKDGHKTPCGPRWGPGGREHSFGGHLAEKFKIPANVEIAKVEVGRDGYNLNGLRFHLSDGTSGGYLYPGDSFHALECTPNEKIVGFYGRNDYRSSYIEEFGIITAPKDAVLPDFVYDMPEFQNTDGGTDAKGQNSDGESDDTSDEDDE